MEDYRALAERLFRTARDTYPVLDDPGISYRYSQDQSGPMLEFWPPGEPGSPDRSRPADIPMSGKGVEVYSDKVRPVDILGDVVSHDLVKSDPAVKAHYDAFRQSLTPEQKRTLRKQYAYSRANLGESRPYETWEEAAGLPAYFRGYAFQQWDDADRMYTPEQLSMFDDMMSRFVRRSR